MLYQDTDRQTATIPVAFVNAADAASYVGISERQVRDLVYRRAIPFTKVGRLLRFRITDLDRWLDANTVRPGGDAA